MHENHFLKSIFLEQNFKVEDLETILGQYHRVEFARNEFLIEADTTANKNSFLANSTR